MKPDMEYPSRKLRPTVCTRLPADVLEGLRALAERNGRSISEEARAIIIEQAKGKEQAQANHRSD